MTVAGRLGQKTCEWPPGWRKMGCLGESVVDDALSSEGYAEFIRRIRAGDQQAAADLVRRYEPEIRLEVRTWLRLRNPRLRRVFDSMDICQSVLASFFLRAAVGEYDLSQPQHLIRLLVGIARNKLAAQVRHHHRHRRDLRRVEARADEIDAPGSSESPSQLIARQELLAEFRRRLTEDERRLAELRSQGHDWPEVAAALGGTAEARRKQLTRAVKRVEQEMGLAEAGD
jgi:RNA polymerase sigma-70 factor (ECF subfamily)